MPLPESQVTAYPSVTSASIAFDESTGTFLIKTPTTAYGVRVTDDGVRHLHWGPPLTLAQAAGLPLRGSARGDEVVAEEFPVEGGVRFGPPALSVEFPGGVRAVEPVYADHVIDAPAGGVHLRIGLVDRHFPLRIDLHYRVNGDSDVIERWAAITHTGYSRDVAAADDAGSVRAVAAAPIIVDGFDAAGWTLPRREGYRLSHNGGEWIAEFALERVPLPYGETTTGSRRGATRHQSNPWLAIDSGDTTETAGEVWTIALGWSGGFHQTVTRSLPGLVTVATGATATRRHLQPGEVWTSPVTTGLYTAKGFGAASRAYHDFVRAHVLPHPEELPPVLFNSWEATWFEVDEANQIDLARQAAALGVELFVMDDGWFGKRDDDRAGLGDWSPNLAKFPGGVERLADEVRRLGMRFGIWVEPEMVNPDSMLYREHPDWVLHMPHRTRTEQRNQLVLNFGRSDVVEWAHGWLDKLVGSGIDFLKWDMNRPFTEAGWPGADDPGRLWVAHTEGVYEVMDRLRDAHPDLRIESCASGGGRVDLGVLRRTDQVWTSDNADPVDRIAIHDGFTQVYPAIVMAAWATADPNPITGRSTPLRFRMHSAMAGALGLSGDLRTWADAERAEARELVAAYKRIRPIVVHGDLHRITHGVVSYVARDASAAVVIALAPSREPARGPLSVRLRGLDPSATYRDEQGIEYSGAVLMAYGLEIPLPPGDYASTVIHLERV